MQFTPNPWGEEERKKNKASSWHKINNKMTKKLNLKKEINGYKCMGNPTWKMLKIYAVLNIKKSELLQP